MHKAANASGPYYRIKMFKLLTGEKPMAGAKNNMASMNFRSGLSRIMPLALAALLGIMLSAACQASDESILKGERPTINGEPTIVEVGIYLFDIDEIDDVRQRFSIDLFISASWKDPRLALPENERRGEKRFMTLDEIWTPRVLILNDRGLTSKLREGVAVDDLGNVSFSNRLSGELSANLEFQDFPFDVQRLPIDVVSYAHSTDEMLFATHSTINSLTENFSIEGWNLRQLEPQVLEFVTPGDGTRLPRLTYIIEAKRDSDYYLLTMLVPMSLIIFMAWTVFWLQPNIVPPRIAISTAAIFSLIALGVSLRLGLPKVSYLTRADIFVLGCTLLVFIALGIAVIGSRWASSDRMQQALKANAIARWVYMVMFIVIALLALYY
jgi:hypothetical protein